MEIFICIFFILISLKLHKNDKFNILLVFNALWLAISILSRMQLYNLYPTSEKAYTIILIGTICFNMGYVISKFLLKNTTSRLRLSTNGRVTSGASHDFEIRFLLIYLLCTIVFAFYIKDLIKIGPYLFNGETLQLIRSLAQDSNSVLYSGRSNLETACRTLMINPFMAALQVLVAFDFWYGKRDKVLFFIDIILVALNTLTDGSRTNLLYLFLHMVIIFSFGGRLNETIDNISKKSKREKKRRKRLFIKFISFGTIALIAATASRSGQNMIKHLYYYFSMEPYMLGTWSDRVDQSGLCSYGMASLYGYSFAIVYFVKNLFGLGSYPSFWLQVTDLVSATDQEWQIISYVNTPANAYVSLFWFPYFDGRYIGVGVVMFIYGMICCYAYISAKKYQDLRHVAIFSILFLGIIMSFVRIQFAQVAYALSFLYVVLCSKRKSKNAPPILIGKV